jgi:NADPH-dependent glutamate synthase beta subunit-like oxidoreductase/ActR/RegA family two-component response regulator/NAD-dependent dihydropyrimidine dehydrogenase PreA subunit
LTERLKKMKPILVVDDEVIVRESLRDWLTDDGYQVEIAEDGDAALKAIDKQDFGLAIVDLMLPGKNGIEVLREAKDKRPYLKGIIITAYASVPTAVEAMKEGAVDYLPKPIQLNQLEALIRDALGPVQVEVKPKAAVAPAEVEPVVEVAEPARVEEAIDEATGKIYLPPCQIACPVGEDIQRTNAMMALLPLDAKKAHRQIIQIGDEIYKKNPLFSICSYICGLCEKECNYKDHTGAIRRKMLKRFISEYYLPYLETKPDLPAPTLEKVAVIGGGPGGLMCAYMLGQRGYKVTVLERSSWLGGALRYIPQYRLPSKVINSTLNNLVRIAHVEVRFGVEMGEDGNTLDGLYRDGYKAVFIATGTHAPRPLTLERETVLGADLDGVISGLYLLYDINQGKVPAQLYRQLFRHRKVIVVGGGNVAFDVARTARRLGGDVTMVCLENEDKSSNDGIPADVEEIEGAEQEGIMINYSRGVENIIGEEGRFEAIKCPRCTSVFDAKGFNPKFDRNDVVYLEGDVLLITIGQGAERNFFRQEGLLDERGWLDVDPLTLMSQFKEGVFIGGDVKRVGFAAEAMRDGVIAAESIDRYLRGEDLKAGREKEYENAAFPKHLEYKPQPEVLWVPAGERLNFAPFEKGYSLEEAVAEARRCLCCGPCSSCKACVAMGLQSDLPPIRLDQDLCSGCGVCVTVCPYDAIKLVKSDGGRAAVMDTIRCKRGGLCVSSCPSGAITIDDSLAENLASGYLFFS